MSIVNLDHLEYYAKLNYNVLMIGLHGIGKTAITKAVFNKMYGDRWRYFSAPTLDPWVDFVGVPETVTDPNGKRWLELIRPKFIAEDQVEALFFDELNRSSDKVQNAIMELTQFKTINGHKLANLKVIWGAINPADDEDTYKVNQMDPAFLDRFHVHKELPYKLDEQYFYDKYPADAKHFIEWWNDMPQDQKMLVSPRRLDYAADAHANQCRLEDFLPRSSNVKKLRTSLKSQPFQDMLKGVKSEEDAIKIVSDINHSTKLLDLVKNNDPIAIQFFEDYGRKMPKELAEPFVEVAYAQRKGMTSVSSMEEMINLLPNDRGTQATAALINNVDFSLLYRNSGSMDQELRRLHQTQIGLIKKLATRVTDILIGCHVTTLSRLLWGIPGNAAVGATQGKPTNLQVLAYTLAKIDRDLYSSNQRSTINQKVYQANNPERRLINDPNWL
jgi:hypothetical protein